jgi:hypothetical protein
MNNEGVVLQMFRGAQMVLYYIIIPYGPIYMEAKD